MPQRKSGLGNEPVRALPEFAARKFEFYLSVQAGPAISRRMRKYHFRFSEICDCIRTSRLGKRAFRPIVTRREAGCDGRVAREKTTRADADGEIVWS
jgi:hypothetical protein